MVFWENMSNSGAKIGGFSNFLGNSPKLRTFEALVHLVLRLCGFGLCGSPFMRKLGVVKMILHLCLFPK